MMKQKNKRTLSSVAFVSAIIVLILLFNIVINAAADKLPLSWDLTENRVFALTKETKDVLSGLREDVTLYYFVSKGQENVAIQKTIDMYLTASSKLKLIESDPNTDPVAARKFTDKGVSLQQNAIILERGNRYRAILPSEIYGSYTTQAGETLENAYFLLEAQLTRAIAYVSNDVTKTAYFTVGHNESDYSSIAETLANENMEIGQIDLKTTSIPPEADVLYIVAPALDFTADEILRLDEFLESGKSAHISFDASKNVLPTLEQYLKEYWGVTMYHDIVCEGDGSRILKYPYIFLPEIGEHAVTSDLQSGNRSLLWSYSRSLSLSEAENVKGTAVVTTSPTAFSRHGSDKNITENIREGSLPLAAVLERKTSSLPEARLFVSSAARVYDAAHLSEASLANATLFYNVNHYLCRDQSALISVTPKDLTQRILLLGDGMTTFYIIAICVLPALAIFAAGVIQFKRRRHL